MLHTCRIHPITILKLIGIQIDVLYIFIIGLHILNLVSVIFKILHCNLYAIFLQHIITFSVLIIVIIFPHFIFNLIDVIVH